MSIQPYLLAIRPKTLLASIAPFVAALGLSFFRGRSLDFSIFAIALICVLAMQIGTNFVNDAKDYEKGADTERRIGPVRVTQSGKMSSAQVMNAAYVFFAIAAFFGVYLVWIGGLPILGIGLCSIAAAYGYTGGPFPLAYRGLGDLFVLIFFGWVAQLGLFFLAEGQWLMDAWVLGTQIGLLCTVLIAINNLRDHREDVKVGKRTLAVRLGETRTKIYLMFLFFTPYALGLYWFFRYGARYSFALPIFLFPISLKLIREIQSEAPSPKYNVFLGRSSILMLLFSALLGLGFYLDA